MTVSNNKINSPSFNDSYQVRNKNTNPKTKNFDPFRVELSTRALLSEEYNKKENPFPLHNTDALSYTRQSKIVYKP